ncbi:tRNA (adenosine(37)-N6)-threonylcarbamoyltransferase complex dimerization subunit type 1 TsaB [Xaviernesmea oryzae]|uniref:tRNA (Adenosine(37)-N6)-threonylcarbamoyltransferase complex dimerization subunit type 1 TsaB n=1 Tax=Xaviernesmea oryzae TaxID=464029 RepID=A0A1Q9AUV9_9HYPH|nr:tRNA (adenosine(37)-N6)-threonylcarbamoyltransferase complex dimerization subunit type 1 TsaB [Xaviernesmea oryzae]OLP59245.1 tRNA (adenosine(37)-N6)-threonylcarbamoyltransferase complex dimerization subunit type 1 TsaB [Xaviernesmea oryzae]SEK79825.1 tRNA threonylcarbamoyladenosine biosynthesis protein TsaB [Xaviernesmea oryzae]
MIVLALDTAGAACRAALFDATAGRLLAVAGEEIGKGHAEHLLGFIDMALDSAGRELDAVDRIAVAVGPGSFTGIRVGVAAARGFGLALDRPVVGISTLSTLAFSARANSGSQEVLAVIDGRREDLFCQSFAADGTPSSRPELWPLPKAREHFAGYRGAIIGSGAALLAGLPDAVSGRITPDPVDIAALVQLGALADPQEAPARPLYLRGPDAKPQEGFAVARAQDSRAQGGETGDGEGQTP